MNRASVESVVTGILIQSAVLVSGVLSARLLGVEGRGHLALIIIVPLALSMYGAGGVPQAITHFVARRYNAVELQRRAMRFLLAQALVLTLIHWAIIRFFFQQLPAPVIHAGWISGIVVVSLLCQFYGFALLQGRGSYRAFNVLRTAPAALYAVWTVVLFLIDSASIVIMVCGWVVAQLAIGLLALLWARRASRDQSSASESDPIGSDPPLLKFGLRGLLGYYSPLDHLRADQLLVVALLSPAALGLYAVAQAFINLPQLIAQNVGMVVFPELSRHRDRDRLPSLIVRNVVVVVAISAAVVVPLGLVMAPLVELLFGAPFLPAVVPAQILLCGAIAAAARRILVECARGLGAASVSTAAELTLYPVLIGCVGWMFRDLDIADIARSVVIAQFAALLVAVVLTYRLVRRVCHESST